ncbi:hypothetical protein H7F15_16510 [Pontibacter sp. Tf4]|uniref:hypothetical protein n=1 Tax=Pontibacter sp. Tf4 TaxID=2761620 RepID=UPI001627A1D9|nr:hypothetical protein [Pontibacter sp. Tf4]MBB6612646.1 hypothetical protein [Pontibacter sp. Tf4]
MTKLLTRYLTIAAMLFVATACEKNDEPAPPATVGLSFAEEATVIDRNTDAKTATIVINVDAPLTKTELEQRLKLNYTSESAKENTDYRIVSQTITENPLRVALEVEALPSLARTSQEITISFDQSMQPITLGTIPEFTLTLLPYSPASTWADPSNIYYQPKVYYNNPETGTWQSIASNFTVLVEDDAAVLGFVNNAVAESGVALFNMVRLYSAEIGSTNIKTARINSERTLEFIPSAAGAKQGTVNVIPQDVTITRANGTTFKIGISGQGTYNEETGLIDVVVNFNETAIGGAASVARTYKISTVTLSL